jgi:hypothetical protein
MNDNVEKLKHGGIAHKIICDTLGFEPQKNKPFVFSDESRTGNDYLHNEGGYWFVKNFATGQSYSAIDAYMTKHRTDFATAVKELSDKYLNGHGHADGHKNGHNAKPPKPFQPPVLRAVKEFKPAEADYWKQFGITGKVLQASGVFAVDAYFDYSFDKNRKGWYGYEVRPNEKNGGLIFAYRLAEDCYKIYRPSHPDKSKRFLWLGDKPDTFKDLWGVDLIPEGTEVILVTEGLKDALTINSHLGCFGQKLWAVPKENAGNPLDEAIVAALKDRYTVLLCMDADKPGQEATAKHAQAHGLRSVDLSGFITDELGYEVTGDLKDVSDLFRTAHGQLMEGETIADLKDAFTALVQKAIDQPEPQPQARPEPEVPPKESEKTGSWLGSLLALEQQIAGYASGEIVFSPPIVSRGDTPVFRRGTINTIQGKFGSHKSRLAELCCSLLLKAPGCQTDFLGFARQELTRFTVCYVDTERGLKEEFPAAIQNVRRLAGHEKTAHIADFRFTSLKQVKRKERLQALKTFIDSVRQSTGNHLFVLLDVVTDCVANFNKEDETLLLYDFLGNLCDDYEVTFLLVIHENPNGDKMRGHTGTEAANKASSALQIGFERGRNGEETELIKVKFIKLRGARKPEPFYCQYSDSAKALVAADADWVSGILSERRAKADTQMVKDALEEILSRPTNRQELIDTLAARLDCGERTIEERLKEIHDNSELLFNSEGKACTLQKSGGKGKPVLYSLSEPLQPPLQD